MKETLEALVGYLVIIALLSLIASAAFANELSGVDGTKVVYCPYLKQCGD